MKEADHSLLHNVIIADSERAKGKANNVTDRLPEMSILAGERVKTVAARPEATERPAFLPACGQIVIFPLPGRSLIQQSRTHIYRQPQNSQVKDK